MTTPEWLSTDEAAALMRLHPNTLRERVRRGQFPTGLVQGGGNQHLRFHRSICLPEPTPIRPADLPRCGRDDVDERVARLLAANTALRTENLELATRNLQLQAQLDELIERRASA